MAKKTAKIEEDDFDADNLEMSSENEPEFIDNDNTGDDFEQTDDNTHLDFLDDSEIDIIIEIDEDDLLITEEKIEKIEDPTDDIVLSKHKIEGKHSLKYDSIFKGKKEDPIDEESFEGFSTYYKESIEVDKSSIYHTESIDNELYIRSKLVKERVYEVMSQHTEINFLNNRRKPSRVDFNQYYSLLRKHLSDESFTNIELFNELSVYFSDNLFNMFKLLDNNWRNLIIAELQNHIGTNKNSKEISNRNLYVGTEIEFLWFDSIVEEEKLITGVVIETDYQNSLYNVDSFEKIYEVKLVDITKILNNSKFKYNLNKLNNIDFL
jgi:hypothetical protein